MEIDSERLIMNKKAILHAVQAGEISPEQAVKELQQIKEDGIMQQPNQQSSENRMQQAAVALYEVEPGVVQLTMQDRVNKNTFSYELVSGLMESFELIRINPNYKVVILTGYDSYFASGGTKEGLLSIYEGKNKFTDTNIYSLALDCKIPVIAAMQGHGIGAGWSMGMFCDLIVMSQESIYTSNYIKYGFTPGAGATLIFPEKLGISLSQEILYTGKKYHGSELKSMGVPFPVLSRKEVLPYAIRLAKTLAESPREALIALKDLMAESIRVKVALTYEKELKMHEKTFVNQPGVRERIQLLYGEASENNNEKSLGSTIHSEKDTAMPGNAKIPLQNQALENSIAIIGIAGQFPQSKTLAEFWNNVAQGSDCISEIPQTRWSIDEYYDPDPRVPGKTNCRYMGALEDVAKFDPLFFGISPPEAECMDPQQRLFLENCWSCIEDAGLIPSSLSGSRCGVFVGCTPSDYGQLLLEQGKGFNAQGFTGGASSILPARISYLLNLKGPCLAIDTACSSSLVAITEACNSLILQTSDLALAGGVSVMAGPSMHIQTSTSGMLSPDGRCFSFDDRANGIVPGEGVGVVLLKRLSDAVRDHDPIYGVMRGWGINQNGKTNGITAPSVNSQILLEKEVYQRFNIDPKTISLVEAHGTGTKLGDSMEVEALIESFQSFTQNKNYCALGSVKSNIGHLLSASGVSGVIKIVLALQHRMLPPTIHFEKLNEYISLDDTPFYINTKLQPWEVAAGTLRRACVNSFGFSGTNAHVVIEEYQGNTARPNPINTNDSRIIVLSAKSEEQLKVYAKSMQSYAEVHTNLNVADMAYTLQTGREAMDYRLAFVADSRETLLKVLEEFINGTSSPEIMSAQVIKGKNGKTQEDQGTKALLQTWIREQKLKEVAKLWVKGLNIDWNKLYVGAKPCRISLPTYPFAREHYWALESKPEFAAIAATSSEMMRHSVSVESLQEELAASLAEALFREPGDIGLDIRFIDMGMDSIVGVNWIQKINKRYGISIAVTKVYDYPTISEFSKFIEKELSEKKTDLTKFPVASPSQRWQFPELIHLNQSTQGQPVFWFHGGLGGIEIYQDIAQRFQRPFYGIQARGCMTDRLPLHGIQAMVAYYIHIIQAVQPEGPYDLGGYSLGGTLAYEATRQLQELGQVVNSIVMLDSIDPARMKKMAASQKNVILQTVNMALASTVMQEPEKLGQTLIHRDEVDLNLENEAFFEKMINLAQTRGLSKTEAQLASQIQQSVRVQQAYKLDDYTVWPLPDPNSVSCYYFRNKSGLFLGELEPYFLSANDEILVDKINYWEDWEQHLPVFKILDVDSSNHMMLLSEPKPLEAIVDFCEKLYTIT